MIVSTSILAVLPLLSVVAGKRLTPRGPSYPPEDVKGPAPQQVWVDTYNAAKAAGKIPSIPPSTLVNGNPSYAGVDPGPKGACSWTVSHCFGPEDVVDAPTGVLAVGFDDGPQQASPPLYTYLQQNNQKATHFMIGSRILDNPSIFQQAINTGGHIAIHTWSHPYMTTLTDLQIVGELGWTAQIIHDLSGLVPAFWRPPYGDIDNRVRAIAKEVFGLYSVIWNEDTFDWCLTSTGSSTCTGFGPNNDAGLDAELQGFYHGPKSPGLIILEHELTSHSVGGFMRNFPTAKSLGWKTLAIPDIWNVAWYQPSSSGIGTGQSLVIAGNHAANASSASSSVAASSSITTPTVNTSTIVAASSGLSGAVPSTLINTNITKIPTPTSLGQEVTVTTSTASAAPTAQSDTKGPTSASSSIRLGWISGAFSVVGATTFLIM